MDRATKVTLCNMCMVCNETDGEVLVLDKVGKSWGGLTFPGGHVENSESILASTIREVKEETGLTVKNLEPCGLIDWCNIDTGERFFVFLYKTAHFSGMLTPQTEEGKVFWMKKEELLSPALSHRMAPNMESYLALFLNDGLHEAYAGWNAENVGKMDLLGSIV